LGQRKKIGVFNYPEIHQFLLKVGIPGWMTPEMKQGSALDAQTLFKTNMYSLGHVAAVITVGTRLPLEVAPSAPVEGNSASKHNDPTRIIIDPVLSLLVDMGKDQDLNEVQLTLFRTERTPRTSIDCVSIIS
jgi:hypothetical protein